MTTEAKALQAANFTPPPRFLGGGTIRGVDLALHFWAKLSKRERKILERLEVKSG